MAVGHPVPRVKGIPSYHSPTDIERAQIKLKESQNNHLADFVEESLSKIIQDINEGKEYELADKKIQ